MKGRSYSQYKVIYAGIRDHKRPLLLILAAFVVFVMTYLLILPALTLDEQEAAEQGGIDVPAVSEMTAEEMICEGDGFRVTATAGKNAELPEETQITANEITQKDEDYDAWCDEALKALQESGDATEDSMLSAVRFYDISLISKGDIIEPASTVNVKISYDKALELSDKEDIRVVHFAVDEQGNLKPEVFDKDDVKINVRNADKENIEVDDISFDTNSFSVYAVIGGTEPTARVAVNFYDGETKVSTMYVKKSDCDDDEALQMILFDPGIGALADGEMFRGWTLDEGYTAEEAVTAFDPDSGYGAMTIEDVRNYVKSQKDSIDESGELQEINLYAMVVKNFKIHYTDPDEVAVGTDTAYMLRDQTSAQYTLSMAYETNDEEYHFKGWVTDDDSMLSNPNPEPGKVIENGREYDLYTNNTKVTLTGDVTFRAHAPNGKWLVFHEVEKGATYVAPQFLEEGERPNMPNPDRMLLLGHRFDGWYLDEDYTQPYDGGPISARTDVYAKWVPATWAPYTVIIWKQNLDGTYAYAESVQLAGTVGSTINSLSIRNNNDADYLYINGRDMDNRAVTKSYQSRHTGRTGQTHNYENPDYIGFNCVRLDQNKTIAPEGNTVVNVYYDRIEYTVKIYHARRSGNNYNVPTTRSNGNTLSLGGMNWTGNISNYRGPSSGVKTETSGNYTYYYTTITAKYGEDISDQWPKYEDYPNLSSGNTNYTFVSWYMMNDAAGYRGSGSGLDTFKGVISKMDEKLLGDISRADEDSNYLIGRYDNRTINIYTYQIWKEALINEEGTPVIPAGKQSKVGTDGKTYYLDESIQANSNADPSGTQAPDYIGYEHIASMDVKPALVNNRATIQFYYHRIKSPIIYRDGAYFDGNNNLLTVYPALGDDVPSEDIPYETDLEEYNKGGEHYKTDYPSSYDGFVFEGWYIDAACTEPYTFTNMPDSSITVYAKFRQSQYRVFLHPNVPDGKTVYWGSEDQEMNFRGNYGENISLPSGKLVDPMDPDILDDSYEFAGWYRDPQFKYPYDPDAYVLNDEITSPYDKTRDMTDPMDEYGNIGENAYNSDDRNQRWWITKKLDLYGKWRKALPGSDGIQVIYDLNGGTGEVKDPNVYKDLTGAIAQNAPTPPEGEAFLYWVLQTWNPAGGEDGQGAYEDIHPMEFVYPGDMFTVSYDHAREVETTDPDTEDIIKQYYVRLRAEYTNPDEETPTHIWWYSNFGDNDVVKTNRTDTADNVEYVKINEAVFIKPEDTFDRPHYDFLGWARVDSTDAQGNPKQDEPKLHPELGIDDLFLKYNAEEDAFYAKNEAGEWVKVTQVAADEKFPYHDLYAVWAAKSVPLRILKVDQTGSPLADATFESSLFEGSVTTVVTGEGEAAEAVIYETDNVEIGTYNLTETSAPAGYNLLEGPVTITVGADADTGQIIVTTEINGKESDLAKVDFINPQDPTEGYKITVMNTAGVELPATGGPGTIWIYLLGTILLLGCGITLAAKRRI